MKVICEKFDYSVEKRGVSKIFVVSGEGDFRRRVIIMEMGREQRKGFCMILVGLRVKTKRRRAGKSNSAMCTK